MALFLTIRTVSLSAYVPLLFMSLFVHVVGHSTLGLHHVLGVRAREHAGVGVRSGQPLSQPPQSAIRDHAIACSAPNSIDLDIFSILCMTNNIAS